MVLLSEVHPLNKFPRRVIENLSHIGTCHNLTITPVRLSTRYSSNFPIFVNENHQKPMILLDLGQKFWTRDRIPLVSVLVS
jgi:hypothetical protein